MTEVEGTVAEPARPGSVLRVRAASIEVVQGPDTGRRARIDQPLFVVGKGDGADLELTDETVSREHLRLSLLPGGVGVRDDGSKNGTWLGGVRVSEVLLTQDAALRIGTTTISIRFEAAPLDLALSTEARFGRAIGESAVMRHVFGVLERAAATDVTVLLEGESGVGKELLASGLHARSARASGPFVAINCGAIPATLVESELFGHVRGAFTGAIADHVGVFEQAQKGTLFLDELGSFPIELQPKLLRVLEQREIRPVGGTAARAIDVRVVAATNKKLAEAVHRGEFRRDLFYRLAVARVVVPPLRDRRDDVPLLARAMLAEAVGDPAAELPADFASLLSAYGWPGNVRELRNVIERYALLGLRDIDGLFDDGPPGNDDEDLSTLPYAAARQRALSRFERSYAQRVLERAGGVVTRAAELAGLARPSFHRMLSRRRPGAE